MSYIAMSIALAALKKSSPHLTSDRQWQLEGWTAQRAEAIKSLEEAIEEELTYKLNEYGAKEVYDHDTEKVRWFFPYDNDECSYSKESAYFQCSPWSGRYPKDHPSHGIKPSPRAGRY